MNGFRVLQLAGMALFALMALLMGIGTTNETMFYTWGVLLFVGIAMGLAGRKLDERSRGL